MKKSLNIKAIAEVLSALVVVISLVFVGLQIDEDARATRSAIAADTTATVSQWYNSLADNADTSAVVRAFLREPSKLTPDERYRAAMKMHSLILIFQSAYYLEEQGTLDAEIRDSITKVILSVGAQKGMAYYWMQRRATPVILYCFKGARTSSTFVALKEAGVKDVRTYFGSWNEWSRDTSLPIEEGMPTQATH